MRQKKGMTLLEVLIAMFIFMVGIVGVLAAIPTGVTSAQWVILQDASIHLAHSKFAEFRRDRVDPGSDLVDGSTYLSNNHEPLNGAVPNWRDFNYAKGKTYQYFDDIERYEWRIDQDVLAQAVGAGAGTNPAAPGGYNAPTLGGGNGNVRSGVITVRNKGTSREFQFTQFMTPYFRSAALDPAP
jgi:type II secretory pathway pseudopilin PulG